MDSLRRLAFALTLAAGATLFSGTSTPVIAQETGTVRGTVVNAATRQPLAGVQVFAPAVNQRTVSNDAGEFSLTGIPSGTVEVRAELLGYAPQQRSVTVAAGEVATLGFALGESAIALDALVVTGTPGGTQRRAVGNVVTQIDAAEVVETAPVGNVQELINGRSPGVVITPASGMVGSGSDIRIRGTSSLSLSSRPLLYVDGVRVDNAGGTGPTVQGFGVSVVSRLNDFNPSDIESIEIIKGPAAATLYGTEASNGVIQIITKKGRIGEPRFSLKVRQGANWFANPEGRIPVTYARNPATGAVEMLDIVNRENELGSPIYRTGHLQGYDLSVSGGAEDVRYYLGGSFDDEEGAERNNDLNRWGGRANLSITPNDKLDLTGSFGYTKSHTNLSQEAGGGGIMWSTLFSSPARLSRKDGSPSPLRGFRTAPPEVYYDAFESFQEVSRFTGSLQVNHRPTGWFAQRLAVGTDETSEDNQSLTERNEQYQEIFGTLQGGKFTGRRDVSYNTLDYSGTATFDVREGLNSSTSVGTQYYRRLSEFVSASGDNFPTPGLTVVDATTIQRGGETFVENTTVGVFAQQQFGWQDRLFLTGALRADDNSAFGEDFDLVYYPKLSGTWVVSEEPFWTLPIVNTLRLRAAYGQSGQQPETFAALRYYEGVAGPGDVAAVTPGAIGNPELGPERGEELELGFDAGFLDDRVSLQFTYYDQRTKDAILLRNLAPSAGFPGSQFVNIGEIKNRGVELLIDGQAVETPDVDWDLSFSFATNDNEVVDLGDDLESIAGRYNSLESRVGFPVNSWFAKRIVSARVDEDGDAVDLMCDGGPENNGQAVSCAQAPRVYLGGSTPKYEGAFTSALTLFDNLRLNTLIDFKTGYKKFNANTWVRCSIFRLCLENVAPQDQDPVRVAAVQTSRNHAAEYINDASFAKLREISATYTVPQGWARRFGAGNASLTVAGRNLYTWTGWTGLDPEARYLEFPTEQNNLPQLTSFVTTINLTF